MIKAIVSLWISRRVFSIFNLILINLIAAKVARDWVMELARGELLSIRLCHECYVNANEHPAEWMSMVCNGHHPVIWAKLNTWPHWPAKLVGRNEEDLTVFVQFFGDKTSGAPISSTNCTKYTEHCPSSHLGKHKDALIEAQAVSYSFFYWNICMGVCKGAGNTCLPSQFQISSIFDDFWRLSSAHRRKM